MTVKIHKYSPSIYTVRLVGDIWSNKSTMQKCCILPECVHFPHQQLGEKGRTGALAMFKKKRDYNDTSFGLADDQTSTL